MHHPTYNWHKFLYHKIILINLYIYILPFSYNTLYSSTTPKRRAAFSTNIFDLVLNYK